LSAEVPQKRSASIFLFREFASGPLAETALTISNQTINWTNYCGAIAPDEQQVVLAVIEEGTGGAGEPCLRGTSFAPTPGSSPISTVTWTLTASLRRAKAYYNDPGCTGDLAYGTCSAARALNFPSDNAIIHVGKDRRCGSKGVEKDHPCPTATAFLYMTGR